MIGWNSVRQHLKNRPDHAFISHISAHCLGETSHAPSLCPPKLRGFTTAKWDGATTVLDMSGKPLALALDPHGHFYSTAKNAKLTRVANVINEMRTLGHHSAVTIDMHDARTYGTTPETSADGPIVTYNRRDNAKNLVLWPLPGFHLKGIAKAAAHHPILARYVTAKNGSAHAGFSKLNTFLAFPEQTRLPIF